LTGATKPNQSQQTATHKTSMQEKYKLNIRTN